MKNIFYTCTGGEAVTLHDLSSTYTAPLGSQQLTEKYAVDEVQQYIVW
jgi:hypothetical protein